MLKSLHIQHYKSLADVYLEFSPITLLVGPNGMGKSNIVDALRFLKDAITHGLDYAIHERGGIDVLRQYAPRRPYTTSLRIDFDYHLGDEEYQTFYSLKIAGKKGDYQIVEEEAFWIDQIHVLGENGQKLDTEVQQVNLHRDKQGNVRINDEKQKQIVPFDQLVISNLPFLNMSPTLAWILRKLCFSSIYPNTLREPSRPDSDRQLKGDGSNWASILKAMRQRKEEQVLKKIEALMRRVIPGFESVRVKGVGGYLVPQFLVQDKPGARSHYLDPVQLSDGTLRIFGLL